MRIAARALACGLGLTLDAAVDAALAGAQPRSQRGGRPFAAFPITGEWHQRCETVTRAVGAALDRRAQSPAWVGSSSWHIGACDTSPRETVLRENPARFAARICEDLILASDPVCVSVACVSGLHALLGVRDALRHGAVDDAVVLGIELDNAFTRQGFSSLQLLAAEACRPFDAARDGMVLGEAFAALRCDASRGSGWHVTGAGLALDRSGPTAMAEDGAPMLAAISAALTEAGCGPGDIGLVKLHGAGSRQTDASEAAALRSLFRVVPSCVSLKGTLGHTLGASGLAELALLTACLDRGVVPPSVGFKTLDAQLGIALTCTCEAWDGRPVLFLAIGFGGQMCALVLEHRA